MKLSQLDYLTSVDYNDGNANEYRTWGYDAAGNRTSDSKYSSGSWVYNILNMMTQSPKVHNYSGGSSDLYYENDILGNRTTRNITVLNGDVGTAKYEWDPLNRLIKHGTSANGYKASYRADGQRIEKVTGVYYSWYGGEFQEEGGEFEEISGYYDYVSDMNAPTQRFFYDGQMGMEDDSQWQTMNTFPNPPTQHHTVMRYGLGARGIDRMEFTNDSSSTSYAYPMYDGHGNMRAVINKSGSSYTMSNWRTYDVWGSVRTQSTSGDPKQRYCANLGHVADDETDLIYMRARYYEPNSGRFINQDPARDGWNWYAYCNDSPTNYVDRSGCDALEMTWWLFGVMFASCAAWVLPLPGSNLLATGYAIGAMACFGIALAATNSVYAGLDATGQVLIRGNGAGLVSALTATLTAVVSIMVEAMFRGRFTAAGIAVVACFTYGLLVLAALWCDDIIEASGG